MSSFAIENIDPRTQFSHGAESKLFRCASKAETMSVTTCGRVPLSDLPQLYHVCTSMANNFMHVQCRSNGSMHACSTTTSCSPHVLFCNVRTDPCNYTGMPGVRPNHHTRLRTDLQGPRHDAAWASWNERWVGNPCQRGAGIQIEDLLNPLLSPTTRPSERLPVL